MKVMKFIYGDLTPAKVSDLKQACKQEVGFYVPNIKRHSVFVCLSVHAK